MTMSVQRVERRTALSAHPAAPPRGIGAIAVRLTVTPEVLTLECRLEARPAALRLPAAATPARRDGLWQHSCCELFVAPAAGSAYREFNFAPSGEWAAYAFTAPRADMAPLALRRAPQIATTLDTDAVTVRVEIDRADLAAAGAAGPLRFGIAAVVEDAAGGLSYWALAHPGPRPDFHDPAGFTLALPGG
jgi:hypothetical protein